MEEKKIILELTVSELLFIREKVCIPYRWGGYKWENEIEKNVREKLETAYRKPVMSAAEYRERLDRAFETGKQEWAEKYIVEATQRELHFEYEIEGDEKTDDSQHGSGKI